MLTAQVAYSSCISSSYTTNQPLNVFERASKTSRSDEGKSSNVPFRDLAKFSTYARTNPEGVSKDSPRLPWLCQQVSKYELCMRGLSH